jgi:Protein of unknown function (DUF3106)
MKKLMLGTLVALSAGLLALPSAYAAAEGQQKMTKEEWKKLTPEQQAEKKAAAKANYDAMTPEQQAEKKAAVKAKYDAMTPEQKAEKKAAAKANYDAMTPEQQAEAKKKFAEKHPEAAAKVTKKKETQDAAK